MHFYFRPSLLLYVYSLVQTRHSSCLRRAGFLTKGCHKVVIVRIQRHENLIGMSIKFDRCWSQSLSSTARGSTDLCSLRSLVLRMAFKVRSAQFGFGTSDPGYLKSEDSSKIIVTAESQGIPQWQSWHVLYTSFWGFPQTKHAACFTFPKLFMPLIWR